MLYLSSFSFLLLIFANVGADDALLGGTRRLNLTDLLNIQAEINTNRTSPPATDQMTPSSSIFLSQYWAHYTREYPILVQAMNYHSDRMGNFIGNYFDDISCAKVTGMHFVGIHVQFVNSVNRKDVFWHGLPTLIMHPNPVSSYKEAVENVRKHCSCTRYCWNDRDPWLQNLPTIKSIMLQGIYLHLATVDHYGIPLHYQPFQHHFHEGVDMASSNYSPNGVTPIIPDVAIHYRCSDNLYGGMGLMSFGTILTRIPKDAKFILVLTEYGGRLNGRPLEEASHHILRRLMTELETWFPDALIIIKRGGNEFTAWAQLALANVTICSPSTFCLWPALARSGITYMPATSYIASNGGSSNSFLDPNFHWIVNPHIYNNMSKETKVSDIISTITWDIPPRTTDSTAEQQSGVGGRLRKLVSSFL